MTFVITPRDALLLLLDYISRFNWRVELNADGDVMTTIGEDVPALPQHAILYAIAHSDDELRALLREGVTVQ